MCILYTHLCAEKFLHTVCNVFLHTDIKSAVVGMGSHIYVRCFVGRNSQDVPSSCEKGNASPAHMGAPLLHIVILTETHALGRNELTRRDQLHFTIGLYE
jgi:hypothetical protein